MSCPFFSLFVPRFGLFFLLQIKKRVRERNGTTKKANGDAGSEDIDTEEDDDSASQGRRSDGIDGRD